MSLADWDFGALESLIEDRGDEVVHEVGVSCPTCRKEDAYASTIMIEGQPGTAMNGRMNCPSCYGLGWVYRNAKCIRGLVTGVQTGANKQLLDAGIAVPGDAVFSPSLKECPLSDYDRLTMLYPTPVGDGQTIVRNAANMDINQTLDTGLATDEDRLWYNCHSVNWCEDQYGRVYQQNADFTINERIIKWIGNKPADGVTYVVKYNAYLEWLVFASPFTRFDNARSLGQKVLIRKAHVIFLNAHKVDSVSKRKEVEASFTTKVTL